MNQQAATSDTAGNSQPQVQTISLSISETQWLYPQQTAGGNHQWIPHNNQYNPFYQFNNPAVNYPTWAASNYQGQPPHLEGGVAQPQGGGNFLTLQIRIINGTW